jgi:hypothetical protein
MADRLRPRSPRKKLRERLLHHLWTRGPQPPEYLSLILCRDVYHCTPAALEEQSLDAVNDHLLCLQLEAEVRQMRRTTQRRKTTLS